MNSTKEDRYIELIRAHKGLIMKVCSMYARNREDFRDLSQDIHLEEHSHEDISGITGMTVNNISVRILRIKKKLKSILEKQGYQIG